MHGMNPGLVCLHSSVIYLSFTFHIHIWENNTCQCDMMVILFWTREIQVQISPHLWSSPSDFGSVTTSQSNLTLQIHWGGRIRSEMAIYFSHHNQSPNWFYRWMLGLFLCKLLIELKSFEQDVIAPWLFLSLLPTPLSSQSDAIWSISLWCGESRAGTE